MAVRFGIVGTGSIAGLHAEAIAAVDGAQLVACYSRTAATAESFAKEHGCDYSTSLEDLLRRDDCDAIVITTPSGTHASIGALVAQQRKHVLCEKPLDISTDKIDQLIDACERNDVLLGVIFQSRFGSGARTLKDAIDRGRFGRLIQCSAFVPWYRSPSYYASASWRGTWEFDGGALMNQGIHAIDLLVWLAGDVQEVSARIQTRVHDIEAEDSATARLQFANGSLGLIQCSTACYPGESRRIEIKGEHGSATLVDDVLTFWEFDQPLAEDAEIASARDTPPERRGASDPRAQASDGHRAQYEDFVAAVLTGRKPAIDGREGRRSVHLIRSIYESSRKRRVVVL